jgi:glycosyltransferase involved in cell wall biosynthesis
MRIGIETSAFGFKNTGTSRYVKCLINSLESSGKNVIQFSPPRNKISRLCEDANIRGIYRNVYRHFFLSQKMNNENLDCAFFPDYIIPPGYHKKSVVVIHDLSFITHPHFYSKLFVNYYTRQLKASLKKNPLIAAVSRTTRAAVIKELNVNKNNIFLLQGYRDQSFPAIEQQKTNQLYLLYVGHIEPRKNLTFLIENFLKWQMQNHIDIKLILAGEIWINSPEIKLLIGKYSNSPSIEFKGYVTEAELEQLYQNASGFVHTSFVEGFGFPVLDAMHYNLPIICTKNTATDEITEGQSITVDPVNNKELLNSFDLLYDEITQDKNQKKYSIIYSEKLMQDQLEIILNRLTSKKGYASFINIQRFSDVEKAIQKTLIYSGIFNSGINEDKIHAFLFDVETTPSDLNRALLCLELDKKIIRKNGQIFLNKNYSSKYAGKKILFGKRDNTKLLKYLNKIPFISAIAFSGGSAHYGNQHDDVDLFIITKPNALYIVYGIIHIGSIILRSRNIICANYLIDEKELEIKQQKDSYTAHQIISLVPFKNKNYLKVFLSKNYWIKNYFPNFEIEFSNAEQSSAFFALLKPLNKTIKILYRFFYKDLLIKFSHTNSLKIEDHILKLHSNDNRSAITKCFDELLNNYFREVNGDITINKDFLIENKSAVNY